MFRANPGCWSDTMFCGVLIAFCIWYVHSLWPKWWHRLSVRNVSSKSSMLKWHQVLWCAHCVLHLTCTVYSFSDQNADIDSACPCFVQIQHVEVTPGFVVCPLCFAPEGLTLHKWVDFTLNGCAHAVGWLHAGWVDLTPAPSTAWLCFAGTLRLFLL